MSEVDVLIVGAGPVGCVTARKLADEGISSLILDRRTHVAGNCYDEVDKNGILLHRYGPHYFRTNDLELLRFLSRFSDFIEADYIVKVSHQDKLYPFPINLDTLELFFDKKFNEESAKAFLESLSFKYAEAPQNSEEFVLSRVGEALYQAFYLNYTLKQWEKHPRELAASVCGRIPVRFNRDERYVDHKYQVMPKNGYTAMYQNMISHPLIKLALKTDYFKSEFKKKKYKAVLYTGPVDLYFDFQLGELPWRSLAFDFKNMNKEYHQPCVQINYPGLNTPYTRSVEIKHVTGQKAPTTTISYETPMATGDPYYPIPSHETAKLYQEYKKLAEQETRDNNVYFFGRLAEYTYINMDQAIEKGFEAGQIILNSVKANNEA